MKEIWKDIKDYEGLYQVSNLGRVNSLNYNHTGKERVLKPRKNSCGYLHVALCKDGVLKQFRVHRLVAEAFIPNPENKPCIDHINTDKTDNRVNNLRWTTHKENCNNPLSKQNHSEANKGKQNSAKPIVGINIMTGEEVRFISATEAKSILGINQGSISSCLKGRYKSAGGYVWRYA